MQSKEHTRMQQGGERLMAYMTEQEIDEERNRNIQRPNCFEIQKFIIKDGKKHPVAIICPGGGYEKVCSYVEGLPFAKRLNEMGISALVVFYRVREQAAYPNPQDDLA